MTRKTDPFVVVTLPTGLRVMRRGDDFEAFEQEDGGWLAVLNGLAVRIASTLELVWVICHSEDKRYPKPERLGRDLFAGFVADILAAETFQEMTTIVFRAEKTIPDKPR